jgi:GxxExxY protein
MERNELEELAKKIVNAAFEVHKSIGPGLLESVYRYCLMDELNSHQVSAVSEYDLKLVYKNRTLDKGFRLDILVENEVIIELKSVDFLLPVHYAQIISYLKLADKRLGFLINFNVPVLKDGIKRFVNKLDG